MTKKLRIFDRNFERLQHGYDHVYISEAGGLNPINRKSEFAGVPLEEQSRKIKSGIEIFHEHGIEPDVFFAPSHTFDKNTLAALQKESNIRIISDTLAVDTYQLRGFTFVPQQSGKVRVIPLKTVTFCYHPNVMEEADFDILERFLKRHPNAIIRFPTSGSNRKYNILDLMIKYGYMMLRRIRYKYRKIKRM